MNTGYLRHLAHFVVAVDTGSVTAAANRLGLSPSAISDSLRVLESYFGEPLVERSRKGITPLPRGAELFQEAGPIVTALERSLDPAEADPDSGEVRISLPSETAAMWFAPVWRALGEAAPGIRLVLHCEDRPQDYGKFTRDLVVRVSDKTSFAGLNVFNSTPVRTALVARADLVAPSLRSDVAAISGLTLISGLGATRSTKRLRDGTEITFAAQVQLESIESRIALMRAGGGVVGCLWPTVAMDVARGDLCELVPGRFDYRAQVSLGTPHKRPASRITHVAEAMQAHLSQMPSSERHAQEA